jgi:signal transduction histidine kinase
MNNAAHALIGRCTDDLIHTCLADLIDDAATAAVIRRADSLSRRETILVRSGGEHVPVAIRGTLMPSHLGGKVFVLNDLTFQRELQRLDLIKEVFRQAALETRVPLSLAASYLERLDKSEVGRADLVDKALKQLRKVDIPLERLLRLASEHAGARDESERAGMEKVLNSVLQEMTDSDRQQICVDGDALDAHVAVERNTLAFCMETMLSFALRTRPLDGAVRIDLRKTAPNGNSPARACFSVTGDWRPQVEAQETADISNRWRRKAIVDLTLGSTILQDIARRAGGTFTSSMNRKSTLNLELDLPLAKTGRD